ncbi:CBS domain pair-containing protein [Geotalea daltonii FRC-32]|uniref:CBS domain pair-containing protein n=1 Tax=Geotalea daltonii (strain DSM 22248 / JCM 15807 / FRC-32) TaxID=316067 RepID=B9M2T8_GEODF|nr:CBS domain-containing protein [Geotalea daltonii]ACM21284.1 CBS domain pair-containing protein [Geotalea daltonii FRC-32]
MLTAADVMTKDNIITVTRETTVRTLAELFTKHRVSSFPVVNENNHLVGIVTETDLIEQDKSLHIPTVISIFDWVLYLESDKKFEKELKKMTGQTVGDIFSEDVTSVNTSTPLNEVADIMSKRQIHALPVVEGQKLVGVVSRIDLIRSMIEP